MKKTILASGLALILSLSQNAKSEEQPVIRSNAGADLEKQVKIDYSIKIDYTYPEIQGIIGDQYKSLSDKDKARFEMAFKDFNPIDKRIIFQCYAHTREFFYSNNEEERSGLAKALKDIDFEAYAGYSSIYPWIKPIKQINLQDPDHLLLAITEYRSQSYSEFISHANLRPKEGKEKKAEEFWNSMAKNHKRIFFTSFLGPESYRSDFHGEKYQKFLKDSLSERKSFAEKLPWEINKQSIENPNSPINIAYYRIMKSASLVFFN